MNRDNEKNKKKILQYILTFILTIILLALIVLTCWLLYKDMNKSEVDDNVLSYTELVKEIKNGNVEKIEMTVGSQVLKVTLKKEVTTEEGENPESEGNTQTEDNQEPG